MATTPQEINIYLYADFNLRKLLLLAERLRGQRCYCNRSQIPKTGSNYWAIFLKFKDGVKWVFRSPLNAYSSGTYAKLIASEATTLKFLRNYTSIPAPDLFHYSPYHMNDIGVPYILMSKAAGRPFSLSEDGPVEGMRAFSTLTPQGKERIMYQLGYFARQLYEHRFPLIGSLVENGDQVEVRECLSPGHLWSNRDKIEGIRRGPFRNESEYYSSLSAALRLQAEQLEMGNSILRAPAPQHQEYPDEARWLSAQNRWSDSASLEGMADSKANRMQYCLASQLLDEVVIPRIVDPFGGSGYCLYNHNLALHDIYVDGDFKITCITDWAFSSTVPPAQVFVPPGLPNPGVPADDYLVSAFRCGFDFISARIGGRTIGQWGSQKFKEWEMMWHFHRLVNQDTDQDSDHLDALCGLALLGFNDGGKISAALLANRMWASDPINRAREPASDTRQWSRNTSIDAAFTERR